MPSLQLYTLALALDAFTVEPMPVVELTGDPPPAATSEANDDQEARDLARESA